MGGTALRESIDRILRRFGDKLGAFKFPPGTVRRLEAFARGECGDV
jgi:hypothetical protein